ncbi:hypothetical protein PLICRDRAFT_321358 [Plicaturopsis crispa FD-325 SS-3]|nr:hypothetical protein PLICRDRAFT_321358 [Plicaturopsis crispa FD-325 SS-3]
MSASPPSVTTVKHYVPRALLPPVIHTDSVEPMPLEGFRSHHHPLGGYLNPGGINKLLRMHRYDQVQLTHDVQEFSSSISEMQLTFNTDDEEDLTICVDGVNDEFPPGQSKHSKRIIIQQRLLESDEDVSRRTQHTILMTASSIYHKLFPATPPEWRFRRHRVLGVLPQYFHAYIFGDWELKEGAVAVFVVPPWYLAPQDMEDFVNTRSFKALPITGESSPSVDQKRQHYWAMIDNVCYNNQIRHFAVTTYEQWVFGCLSDDWKDASISEIRGHRACSPTILETLLFWMRCGLGNEPGMRPSEDLFWGDPKVVHEISSLY